ncbi:MAG: hypothetical protein H0T46_34690 [Deltaproteobacteria bacterium]|nr:hypothetical protein [Deltaproteobacteria bacterium]
MNRPDLVALALVVGLLAGCGGREAQDGPRARRAFYYWRTVFTLTPVEQAALSALHVDRIYLRVFDLAWDDTDRTVTPLGPVVLGAGTVVPASVEIVPVVYIKNDVLKRVTTAGLPMLARKIWADVQTRASVIGFRTRELQLDCDWTDSTRDAFFGLTRELAIASTVPLSSTIRLHQVKYRERTGVPPVGRGTLMFYNMGTFSADRDARMIFDAESAAKYLARIDDYPLPLDIALPIWSWTVHTRDDLVIDLMQSTDPAELPRLDFLAAEGPDRFVATRSAFLHGSMIREGDVLKIEVTGPAETQAAAAMLAPHLSDGSARTITLFDLSERNLTRHGTDQLETTFRSLR